MSEYICDISKPLLIAGECAEVMAGMERGSVDMVITSPPYDQIRAYNGFDMDVDAIIGGIWHVLRKGGVCIWVTGDQMVKGSESGNSFRTALKFMKRGFLLHDTMIYQKRNPMPNKGNDRVRYHQSFEYMFCFAKGKPDKFNPIINRCSNAGTINNRSFRNHGKDTLERRRKSAVKDDKVADNVFCYSIGNGGSSAYKPTFAHPAVFPEKLAYDQIRTWTDEGDTVLDPMCGSGTAVFCAHAMGRKAIGIDVSPEYIELTRRRINEQPVPDWMERRDE